MSGEAGQNPGEPDSRLQQYFYGWWFRSSKPQYREGDEFAVYVFNHDEEDNVAIVNVGDTRIEIQDVPPEIVGQKVEIKITSFDESSSEAKAEFLETVGETTFG